MAIPDDQLHRWQEHRAARLRAIPWLRQDLTGGRPARYVANELLVRADQHDIARRLIVGLGHRDTDISTDEYLLPGLHRLRVTGLDVPTVARRVRAAAGPATGHLAGPPAAPNHVFLSTPYDHGGPYGPAVPAPAPASGLHTPATPSPVRVTVLDTGVWADSPLPSGDYHADPEDFETVLDADADGHLDSDVGHANFIAGVVLRQTGCAGISIEKVLDTQGVATEIDVANALLALADVDIVNLSLGGYTVDDQPPVALQSALSSLLTGRDRVAVAAAGNDATAGRPFWPAAFTTAGQSWSDRILAVAAHDGQAVTPWSNTGPWITLAAPGDQVTSTYINYPTFTSGWAQWSGTSFAAPYLVAAIAEQVTTSGSVLAAAQQVRKLAAPQTYGPYPGLP
jgi:hypothetical protein